MNERAGTPGLGEWQASDDGSHIYSDRFETDAMLVLSGNFGSVAKRKRCADQIAHDLNEAADLRPALDQERERWEKALRLTWQMIDPLKPAGTPSSYARGFDAGVAAALITLRENALLSGREKAEGNG